MDIVQLVILLTGSASIWLAQDPTSAHWRWAAVFALIGQPFWLYTTWTGGQMGVFLLSVFHTVSWLRGLHRGWGSPAARQRRKKNIPIAEGSG